MPDVLVVGPVVVEHLAIADGGWRRQLGGSGLTAALVSAARGAETAIAGWVGSDEADEAKALLQHAGVDADALAVLPGASAKFIIHDRSGAVAPAPQYRPSETSPQSLPRPALRWAAVTVAFGSPDADPIAQGWLDSPNSEVLIWDRQGWLSRARDAQLAALVPADKRIWLGNVDEARTETGKDTAAAALDAMPPANFGRAIVKDGPWGVVVRASDGAETRVGAYASDDPSTIGTGDAFAGALAAEISLGQNPEAAARWACAVAAAFLAQPSNAIDEGVITRADDISRRSAVFVNRRELEQLSCLIQISSGPAEDLVRSAVAARVSHLGLRVATDPKTCELVVADQPSRDGSESLVLSFVEQLNGEEIIAPSVEALTAALVCALRHRYGRTT